MAAMKRIARDLGRDHALAAELWVTGIYEARIVAALVDEPALVTLAQMDRWCADFDNWAICDRVCFSLFDRAPGAWSRVEPWARDDREFVRRASFALLWSLALHDGSADDACSSPASRSSSSTPLTSVRSSRSRCRCPYGPSGDATPPCREPSVPPRRGWPRRTADLHGASDALPSGRAVPRGSGERRHVFRGAVRGAVLGLHRTRRGSPYLERPALRGLQRRARVRHHPHAGAQGHARSPGRRPSRPWASPSASRRPAWTTAAPTAPTVPWPTCA